MNQSEFAALHGVSRKTVTKWKMPVRRGFAASQRDVGYHRNAHALPAERSPGCYLTCYPICYLGRFG
ncbi:hypothetical protein DF058_17740 [Burkholderia cenocepacia]|nr:hypothetical protein DF058_17740 [Burkholderia cenocepacia]RRA14458.1 hypothetical protein DF059_17890 [Burkholderia cenocepacia]